MRKTILQIAKYYHPVEGGIETVTKYMAEGLTSFRHIVVCFSQDGITRMDDINGVRVYRIAPSIKISSQDIAFSYYYYLKKIIYEVQPDIILLHCPNPFLYPITAKLTPRNTKLVLYWHSDILGKGLLYRLISNSEKKILRKADMILATSNNYIHESSPIFPYSNKTKVVANGIIKKDFQWRLGDEITIQEIKTRYHNKKIVFFVGRHATYKGLNYLIEAEKYIKSDCIILIGGRGSETEKLKASCHSDRIKFIGRIPNEYLRCYYYASDIFAFTSCTKQEAFGIALAEAMYCGCVPVTFSIEGSGANWVSVKNETGIEVELGDVKAYAEAIDKLLSNHDMYYQYAAAGKKRVASMFTSEQANIEAGKILNELIDNNNL
ncbi:glycosyltransferase [Prevotella sp. P6B1]|uniref:glycosyltransferase n=1 Tax=Prevotella sp. P6B1 TaxID=1410613 RepID=UPI00051B62AB|nr:glycosyltransferase [Prevotella sp. P6B1]